MQATCMFSTIFGARIDYDTIVTYALVEEDGELEILHCKGFSNPKKDSALIAGTVKAATERMAA